MSESRQLPAKVEMEQQLIACCMIDNGISLGKAIEAGINQGMFYDGVNGMIFALLVEMMASGHTIDETTVYIELTRRKLMDRFPKSAPFHQISAAASTTSAVPQLIEVVVEQHTLRRAIRICTAMADNCYAYEGGGIGDTIAGPINQLLALSSYDGAGEPTWDEVVQQAATLADEIIANKGKVAATIDFPWPQMNQLFGPMQRGQLVVVAARPSVGKSSLVRPIACHAARNGHKVYFDTLEVNPVQVAMQLASTLSRIGIRQLGQVHPKDQAEFKQALLSLRDAGITMSRKDRSLAQIVARAKALSAQGKLDMLVVDHGGLLQDVYGAGVNDKVASIGRMTKTLKALAGELNCVCVLLWQLNRESVKGQNREPVLSDLKDSGSLEEDADKVLMIHRPPEDPLTKMQQPDSSTVAEVPRFFQNVIQAKGRDDGTSLMSFYFQRDIASFFPVTKNQL